MTKTDIGIYRGLKEKFDPEVHVGFFITTDTGELLLGDQSLGQTISGWEINDGVLILKLNTGRDIRVTFPEATETVKGLLSAADKAQLNALQANLDSKVDKVTGKSLLADSEIEKLAGLPNSTELTNSIATAKAAGDNAQSDLNAHKQNKSNPHEVTKAQVGLGNVTNDAQVKRSEMGVANGVATLDADGKVPASQLPSYVDDIIDVYATYSKSDTGVLSDVTLYLDAAHTQLVTGEAGKIYQNIADGEPQYQFRWTGTIFSQTGASSLILGEVTGTAYDGAKGKANADNIAKIKGTSLSHIKDAAPVTTAADKVSINYECYEGNQYGAAGTDHTADIPAATTTKAGVMSATDKTKLENLNSKLVVADEEDVTAVDGKIKLKDRDTANGMGYKILRLPENGILTQDMINESNTIYEIRYDFDLGGSRILELPENSKIVYNGGSISNGLITLKQGAQMTPNGTNIQLVQAEGTESVMSRVDLTHYLHAKGISDAVLTGDLKMYLTPWSDSSDTTKWFTLDGQGHRLLNPDCRILSPNVKVKNTVFGDGENLIMLGNYDSSVADKFGFREGFQIYENCTFYRLDGNSLTTNIEFINCTFYDSRVEFGIEKKGYDKGINLHARFINCIFHTGPNNANNREVIHSHFMGWRGSVLIENCTFYGHKCDEGESDIIDGYDASNITINNCNFFFDHIPYKGEGTINIKSHSYHPSTDDSSEWNYTDKVGIKCNCSITNCQFVFTGQDSEQVGWVRPTIYLRSTKRQNPLGEYDFHPRHNIVVANNNVHIKLNNTQITQVDDLLDLRSGFIYNQDTFDNTIVSNNSILIEGPGGTEFIYSLFFHNRGNGDVRNILFSNNVLKCIDYNPQTPTKIGLFNYSNSGATTTYQNVVLTHNLLYGVLHPVTMLFDGVDQVDNYYYDSVSDTNYQASYPTVPVKNMLWDGTSWVEKSTWKIVR